jgi:hypothetical protein
LKLLPGSAALSEGAAEALGAVEAGSSLLDESELVADDPHADVTRAMAAKPATVVLIAALGRPRRNILILDFTTHSLGTMDGGVD